MSKHEVRKKRNAVYFQYSKVEKGNNPYKN